ncbi:MAG: transcriptional activator NhaR [Acidobacteriia bacterium]|nr:transcriptional activator NhaR [Terriglobia bacterium]
MEWLNYHHLLYFWTVVRTGSVTLAGEELRLASPTISAQIRSLETSLGEKLLQRSGRNVLPTEMGRLVFRYADEIFSLGRELRDTMKDRPTGRPLRVDIGIADVLPKLVVHQLIQPALHLREPVQIVCREASPQQLVARLAINELDVVLSDGPMDPSLKIRAYNHLLGECGISFIATPELAEKCTRRFPKSLHGAPCLLPADNSALRQRLDQWFEAEGIRPRVVGEFEDYALLWVFGERGAGIFPAPSILAKQWQGNARLRRIGRTHSIRTQFYAISVERKIQHPAVVAICEAARQELFH